MYNRFFVTLLLLLSVYCCLPLLLRAGPGCTDTLHLVIQSREEGKVVPVIGAVVGIGSMQSITDETGFVRFEGICPGKIHVHVHALGYHAVEADVPFKSGRDTLHLFVKTIGVTLDNIEIKGHRQAMQTPNVSSALYQEDLDKTRGGNLAESLEAIVGVRKLQTGAGIGKPVIQGMHSNRILILNNGIRQEGQQWGAEHAPEIDPFTAQSMVVVKGAEGVRFGSDAIGGVVLLEPAPLPVDSMVHAEVNLVGASNGRSGTGSAMLSGNVKKWPFLSWRLQGTLKQQGNMKTADYFLENSGLSERNYAATLAYTKAHMGVDVFYSHFHTRMGIFKGAHIGSLEDLQYSLEQGRPYGAGTFTYELQAPRQVVVHDLLKIKSHLHVSDYWHLNLVYGWQRNTRQEFDIRRGGRGSLPSQDIFLQTHTVDVNATYFDGRKWKAILGMNGLYQHNRNVAGTLTTPLIPDYVSNALGAYAIGRLVQHRYELEAGLRYDIKNINALGYDRNGSLYGSNRLFPTLTGSLGAVWHMSQQWDMRSHVGTAWRAPSVNELYSRGIHQSAGAYELGDSSLHAEKSLKWISSVQYNGNRQWLKAQLDVYAHYIQDYIYLSPTGTFYESLSGSFPIFQQMQTNARFLGADLTATARIPLGFDYTLKASVLRAKDMKSETFLPMIPADRLEQQLSWRPGTRGAIQQPYLQLAYEWVRQQDRFMPATDFAPPPPAYQLLHVHMGTQLSIGRQTLGIHFSVDNLTNALYKDYLNRFRYFAHDMGRNFTLRITYRI